jgi:drug/metabolite transporter (DMT)-like permease
MTAREPVRPSRVAAVRPLAAALVTVVLWASAYVGIRHVGQALSPGVVALARLVTGSAALGGLVVVRSVRAGRTRVESWPRGRAWLWVVVCGVSWFGVYNVALNAGEQRIDAGTAAMLVKLGPVLIAVLAGVFLGEGLPRRLVLGSAVALAGVVVICLSASARLGTSTPGVVLCVVAAIAYAIGVVAQKPLLANVSALRVTWLACTVGALSCLPFAGQSLSQLRSASWSTIAWVLYLGLLPTAVGFTTWAYALARSPAGRLATMTYLVPPVAILLGWLLLGETPALPALAGGALCLAGVYVTQRDAQVGRPARVAVRGTA